MTAFLHINIVLDRIVCVHTLVAMITYTLLTAARRPPYQNDYPASTKRSVESGCERHLQAKA